MNQLSSTHPAFGLGLTRPTPAAAQPPVSAHEALQARFALRIAAALTEQTAELDLDITERLRFARENALARARHAASGAASQPASATSSRWNSGRWLKLASVLPAIAVIAGLLLIQRWQDSTQISTAAEVDAALLSDDLPPTAYSDAGFVEFLKSPNE
jgi:hypothetical protein